MAKKNVALSAPWHIYYSELCELFKEDDEVHIIYDEADQIINIYVDNQAKADAMTELIPSVQQFGNVELEINIVPANKLNARRSQGSIYKDLFNNNPICTNIVSMEGVFVLPITYVIFKKKVVQYFNDDLGDAYGMCSTLYEDIARRIFKANDEVYFCTDINDADDVAKLYYTCSTM